MDPGKKVAVITGASQGIGAALVAAYRERDHRVVATALQAWSSNDPDILVIAGDIGERNTARQVIAAASERFGRIDTLINNAGVFSAKPFTQYTGSDYETTLAVNVSGFFHTTQRPHHARLRRPERGSDP